MTRINVIGASGTGKSTLAKALARELGIPHFDSDHFYHRPTDPPFQKQRTPEDRFDMVMEELGTLPAWALSGAVGLWEPKPVLDYTLMVFLYAAPALRLERLRARELALYGDRIRPGGDMQEDHEYFMEWTAGYDTGKREGTNSLPNHEKLLASMTCPVLRLESPLTADEQLAAVLKCLKPKGG